LNYIAFDSAVNRMQSNAAEYEQNGSASSVCNCSGLKFRYLLKREADNIGVIGKPECA